MMNGEPPPQFSIVLPTHNRAHLLPRAVCSVLGQSFTDFELIVVDDASTDSTPQVMKTFDDPRIQYVRHQENKGVSASRNAGVLGSRGRYISFLDDDDEFEPEFLAVMNEILAQAPANVGFAWSGAMILRDTPSGEELVRQRTWGSSIQFHKGARDGDFTHLSAGTGFGLTVVRECLNDTGPFDENLRAFVDTDLLIRLGAEYGYVIVPQLLIRIHLHDNEQITDVTPRRAEEFEKLLWKHQELLSKQRELWIGFHRRSAMFYFGVGNKRRGRFMACRMLRKQPFQRRAWKSYLCWELFGTEKLGIRRSIRDLILRLPNPLR